MKSEARKKRNILLIILGIFVITGVMLTLLILDWRVVEVELYDGMVDIEGKNVVSIDSLVLSFYPHFGKVVDVLSEENSWTRKLGELLGDYDPVLRVNVDPGLPFAVVNRIYAAAGAAGIGKVRFVFENDELILENPSAVSLEPLLEPEEEKEAGDDETAVKDGPPRLSDEDREKRKAMARARVEARFEMELQLLQGLDLEEPGLELVVAGDVVLLKAESAIFAEGDSMSVALEIRDDERVSSQLAQKLVPALERWNTKFYGRPETVDFSADPKTTAGRVLMIVKSLKSVLDEHYGSQEAAEDGGSSILRAHLSEAEVICVSGSDLSYLGEEYALPSEETGLFISALHDRLDRRRREVLELEEWFGIEAVYNATVVCETDAPYSGVFVALYHFTRMDYYPVDIVAPGDLVVPVFSGRNHVDKAVSQDIILDPKRLSIEPAVIKTLSLAFFGEEPDWTKTGIPPKPVRVDFDQNKGDYEGFRNAFAEIQLQLSRSKYASEPYQATIFCEDGVPIASLVKTMLEIRVGATRFQKHETLIPNPASSILVPLSSVMRRRPQIMLGLGNRNSKNVGGGPLTPVN